MSNLQENAKIVQGIRFIDSLSEQQKYDLCNLVDFDYHLESGHHKQSLVYRIIEGPEKENSE